MKKTITSAIVAGLAGALSVSAETSATFDFASAYVFRGVTYNEDFVFQPGLEATGLGIPEEFGAVTLGAWANYDLDDYDGYINNKYQFSEVDLYASYSLPLQTEGLDIFVGYVEYAYPTSTALDDKEANAGVTFESEGFSIGATAFGGVGATNKKDGYYEGMVGYSLPMKEGAEIGVEGVVGFLDDREGETGWSHYNVTASGSLPLSEVWSLGASVTYVGQIDDEVLVDADIDTGLVGYDTEVVGMLSLAAAF